MSGKNILAIWLFALLTAVVLATPTPIHEAASKDFDLCKLKNIHDKLAPSENDKHLKANVQLMRLVLFDLQKLGLSYAKRAKEMSDLLLKDPVVVAGQQAEVVKFRGNMQEYEKKYLACSEMDDLFDLVDLYSNATAHYYEMAVKGDLSEDSKVVYDVLKKYSPKEIDAEYENEFLNNFVHKFAQKINELKENLKKEDGEMGVKILQWWEKTKTLKTIDEKIAAFKEYMKLYGLDD